jgi:drug/metabolite transporter (DMT)-like permease
VFGATDLWLLGIVLLWGANTVASKIVLEVMPSRDLYALRMVSVALLLWPIWRLIRPAQVTPGQPPVLLVLLAGLLLTAQNALFFWGLRRTTADIAALVGNASPLWAALALVACGFQLFRMRNWAGFALGLGGAALMTFTGHHVEPAYAPAPGWGALACLLSAMCFGFYIVLTKGLMEQYGALRILTLSFLIGGALSLPVAALSAGHVPWAQMAPVHWTMLFINIAVAGALGFGIWYHVLSRANASRSVLYLYLVPVFAAIIAWIFLEEVLSPGQMVGIVVTTLGIYLARPEVGNPQMLTTSHKQEEASHGSSKLAAGGG